MRILVTGATGLLGSNVVKVAAEKYGAEVIGTIHKTKPLKSLPCALESMDITDNQQVIKGIEKYKPNVVIHSAALVDAKILEENNNIGWKIFVEGTKNLANACKKNNAKMIFVSSDWIFDGLNPPYRENSIPHPINYYGFLKVIGETVVQSICKDYGIARVSAVYGINWAIPIQIPEKPYGFGSLVNYFLHKFQIGEEIKEWTDYINIKANPTLASDAAEALINIYIKGQTGIFHCSGRECITRVELAKKVAKIFGFDEQLVTTAFRDKNDLNEWIGGNLRLPKKTCLDTTETEERLNRKNLGIEEGLIKFKKEMERVE